MNISNIKPSQKTTDILILVAVAIAVIIVYKMYKGAANAVDAVKDVFGSGSDAKKAKQVVGGARKAGKLSPFSPDYKLPTPTGKTYIETVKNAAKIIKDNNMLEGGKVNSIVDQILDLASFWNFQKSSTVIPSIFRTFENKKQVAQVSKEFYKRTGKTILQWLDENGTDAASKDIPNSIIAEINDIVNGLSE